MIRGIIYLTGLVTLSVIGLVAAVAFEVHKWPWKDYIRTGRKEIAGKLDPGVTQADEASRGDRGASSGHTRCPDRAASSGHTRCPDRGDRAASPHVEDRDWARAPGPRVPDRERPPVVRRHVVRRNQTLYAIAARYYGSSERWPDIARANEIRRPSDLRVGRAIVIPYDTVAFEDRTDGLWTPDLRLRFSKPLGESEPDGEKTP